MVHVPFHHPPLAPSPHFLVPFLSLTLSKPSVSIPWIYLNLGSSYERDGAIKNFFKIGRLLLC